MGNKEGLQCCRRMDLPPIGALASRPLQEHDGLICYPISFLQVFYFASIICLHGSTFRLLSSCCSESLTDSSNCDLCVDFQLLGNASREERGEVSAEASPIEA